MALWGNKDNLQGPTPVTIVGTATSEFWTAAATGIGTIATGTTIVLGGGGSAGFAVVEASLGADLVKVNHLSALAGSNDAVYSLQPISLKNDPGYAPTSADGSLGRTQRPVGLSSEAIDHVIGTVWEADHSGWVGVTTYMDNSATPPAMRVKKEVLVAMSGIQTGGREYPGMFTGASIPPAVSFGTGASIAGAATSGTTLTATAATFTGGRGVITTNLIFQESATGVGGWSFLDGNPGTPSGGTATFTLTASEIGKYIRASYQVTDDDGTVSSNSASTGQVTA